MAIYTFHAQRIARGNGRNAVRAAAYRHRERMRDELTGEQYSYRAARGELAHSEVALPDTTPPWLRAMVDGRMPAQASAALWNKVQAEAKRANAIYAREIVIGLPVELTREQQIALTRDYVRAAFTARGMVADWVIHEKPGNPHAHIMLTTRPLSETGFSSSVKALLDEAGQLIRREDGKLKYAVWNDGPALLREWREAWARIANYHLQEAGLDVRIDHRSLLDRGSRLEPNIHLGPDANGVRARYGQATVDRERDRIRRANAERIRANPAELIVLASSQAAVFRRADVERIARRYLPDEAPEALHSLVDQALSSPDIRAAQSEMMDWRNGWMIETTVYATREMIALEQRMAEQARDLRLNLTHGVESAQVEAAIQAQDAELRQARSDQAALSEEQSEAIRYVTDARGIAAVVGFAGSGKSTMLKAAHAAWTASGKRVLGAALAGKAAESLEETSGIKSRTLASWEYAWSQGRDGLHMGDVFVIDEAAMISSVQLGRVIDVIHQAGAKVVLVGDAMQLQPIQAGAAFRAISERVGYVELEGIRRQRAHEWQRQASLDFARGRTLDALHAYHERGSVRFHETAEAAHTQIVADWADAIRQGSVLILTHANKDVDALNAAVRAARKAAGELSGTEIQFQTSRGLKSFAVGDRVLFLKNEMDVKNGMLGTVEGLGLDTLTIRTDRGHTVTLKPSEYEHFSHGYAATVHKSQGATVDRTLVYASDRMDRHLAYVGMTRHRDDAVLYASKQAFASFADLTRTLSRDGSSSTTLDHDFMRQRVSVAEAPAPVEAVPGKVESAQAAGEQVEPDAARMGAAKAHPAATRTQSDTAHNDTAAKPAAPEAPPEAVPVRRGPRPRILIHPVPVQAEASAGPGPRAQAAALDVRVRTDPAYFKARGAMRQALGIVWKTPTPLFKDIEARIEKGEDLAGLAADMREQPERIGELRGLEEAQGLLARLMPESAAVAAARVERGAARADAAFAAAQVERAAAAWRTALAKEQALQAAEQTRLAARAKRMGQAVPALSDRAHGLLRAFAEAAASGADAARLAAARALDRRDLIEEILRFDVALTRRFGPEAFTERAQEPFEDYLGDRNRWATEVLKELGPRVRRFTAEQQAIKARLAQAPAAAETERRVERPAVVESLFPALTTFERALEDAARARVATSPRFQERVARVRAAASIVFRDPERAMKAVLEALPDQGSFDRMMAPVFASPAGLAATFGELAGRKGLFIPRAERQAREAAERTGPSFVAEARELQAHHAGAVRSAIEAETEARAAAAIPVPGLSEEASQALDQIQGTNEDWIMRQYRDLAGRLTVQREIRAFSEAVERKFGYAVTIERVWPQPTAAQRALFVQVRRRLETAWVIGRSLAEERAKVEALAQTLRQKNVPRL